MNEYVISFINESNIYQELVFRGVSEAAATAMASGLLAAQFQQVGLTVKEVVDRAVTILPGQEPQPSAGTDDGMADGGTE